MWLPPPLATCIIASKRFICIQTTAVNWLPGGLLSCLGFVVRSKAICCTAKDGYSACEMWQDPATIQLTSRLSSLQAARTPQSRTTFTGYRCWHVGARVRGQVHARVPEGACGPTLAEARRCMGAVSLDSVGRCTGLPLHAELHAGGAPMLHRHAGQQERSSRPRSQTPPPWAS